MLQVVVDKGFLGKKTGKGFYLHDAKNKKGPKVVNPEIEAMLKQVVKPPAERVHAIVASVARRGGANGKGCGMACADQGGRDAGAGEPPADE